MANYAQIKRWEILIMLIKKQPYISKKELLRTLEADYEIATSYRTIERDLNLLATDFHVEITYDHQKKGYCVTEDHEEQVVEFLKYSGRIFLGEFFREALRDFDGLKDLIKPEYYSHYQGIEHIQTILLALRNHFKISFIHENFQKNTRKSYQITPLQLREFERRWYVVGVPENENHIKTFGLSRISNLKVLELTSLIPSEFIDQLKKFDRIVGLNYDASESAEIIQIVVSNQQYKYLKTLPLHSSQKLEEILPDGRVRLSLFLIPNYELNMHLLKMGDQVEVLKPLSLRENIKRIISRSLNLYKDH